MLRVLVWYKEVQARFVRVHLACSFGFGFVEFDFSYGQTSIAVCIILYVFEIQYADGCSDM